MINDVVTSGGLFGDGCVLVGIRHPSVTAFGIGDVVYSLPKARVGRLEKVVIKTIRVVTSRRTFGGKVVLYEDTLNGLWNEDELAALDATTALAAAYWQRAAEEAAKQGKC